jgi:hypothetical protein
LIWNEDVPHNKQAETAPQHQLASPMSLRNGALLAVPISKHYNGDTLAGPVQRFLDLERNGVSGMGCANCCAFLLFRIFCDAVSCYRSFVLPRLLPPSPLLLTPLRFAITAIIVTVIIIASSIFAFIAISPASIEHILVDIWIYRARSD